MALLDRDRNFIVLRVVYDGPPEAGKTTSLRALAGSLGQNLISPAEQSGRTLFFDWLDYTGGRFEGYEIRCQIVSVPGQDELSSRRQHLLRGADVVVFVADSTRCRLDETEKRLAQLASQLGRAAAPPVGLILQANKRDLPDAVPIGELRARLRPVAGSVGIVESVAADGTGIREAFVFAVRLALDRVREQLRTETLPVGHPDIDSSDELLAQMKAVEGDAPLALTPPPAAPLFDRVLAENAAFSAAPTSSRVEQAGVRQIAEESPWPPDPAAPSGAIWPPVEGRLMLHEAAGSPITTHRLRNGAWVAGIGNGWRIFSSGQAVYSDLEAGRETLIRMARLHVGFAGVLSVHRCIVLSATGHGTWRLWQIVRADPSLRDDLEDIDRCDAETAAARLAETAALLTDIGVRLQKSPLPFPCSLDTIGRSDRGAVYVGLVPMDDLVAPATSPDPPERLLSELEPIFNNVRREHRPQVLAALGRSGHATLAAQPLREILGRAAQV